MTPVSSRHDPRNNRGMRPENRLRAKADFEGLRRSGERMSGREFVLYHHHREAPEPRVGFSVSRRIGGAVIRNRVRRMLREAIRPLIPRLVACDIVIVARPPAVDAGVADLAASLEDMAARAGLLQTKG